VGLELGGEVDHHIGRGVHEATGPDAAHASCSGRVLGTGGRGRARGSRCEAGEADQPVQDVVLRVDGDDAEDRVAIADDEAPDGNHEVDGAQTEGVVRAA
jgi:hypothetical protein